MHPRHRIYARLKLAGAWRSRHSIFNNQVKDIQCIFNATARTVRGLVILKAPSVREQRRVHVHMAMSNTLALERGK